MNSNLYENCIMIAALASCIIKDDDNEYIHFGYKKPIEFSDELKAVINYESLCSTDNSKKDYEIHKFIIKFYKKDTIIDSVEYEKKLNKKYYGSLANPRLSIEEKLEVLKVISPNILDKIKVSIMNSTLNDKDIKDIEKKCEELKKIVKDLDGGNKVLKKMR